MKRSASAAAATPYNFNAPKKFGGRQFYYVKEDVVVILKYAATVFHYKDDVYGIRDIDEADQKYLQEEMMKIVESARFSSICAEDGQLQEKKLHEVIFIRSDKKTRYFNTKKEAVNDPKTLRFNNNKMRVALRIIGVMIGEDGELSVLLRNHQFMETEESKDICCF